MTRGPNRNVIRIAQVVAVIVCADETGLRRLGVNLTTEAVFSGRNLFQT